MADKVSFKEYNEFCKELQEGDILYNLDYTNKWGKYLLVMCKAYIRTDKVSTYCILLTGLERDADEMKPTNKRIHFTPSMAQYVPFLKHVGHCDFFFTVNTDVKNFSERLAEKYDTSDIWEYSKKIHIRKPKKRKYDADSTLIVKDTVNCCDNNN